MDIIILVQILHLTSSRIFTKKSAYGLPQVYSIASLVDMMNLVVVKANIIGSVIVDMVCLVEYFAVNYGNFAL